MLIPEGLLQHISEYKHLIDELHGLFSKCKTLDEASEMQEKCLKDNVYIKECLTPWSYSLFEILPEFMRLQLVFNQHV